MRWKFILLQVVIQLERFFQMAEVEVREKGNLVLEGIPKNIPRQIVESIFPYQNTR